ncbi:MAG: hypothetical protein OEM97_04460 [Acidimicrobiia bacterium]|nr:hypothetical protein [Acidimicrobiia bacterium]
MNHHVSWFPGAEGTPIGHGQRSKLLYGRRDTRSGSGRTVLLFILATLAIVAVAIGEHVQGAAAVLMSRAGAILGASALGATLFLAAYHLLVSRHARHARAGLMSRLVKGGGAHV